MPHLNPLSSLTSSLMSPETFPRKWTRKFAKNFHTVLSYIVFLYLDFLEILLCVIYRHLDKFFEGKASSCYCVKDGEICEEIHEVSETLHGRKNIFRKILGFLGFARKWEKSKKLCDGLVKMNRWSDCGCDSCVSWIKCGNGQKLHVEMLEPQAGVMEDSREKPMEDVVFLHGFASSSSIWTETVFKHFSDPMKNKYRMFAVDLLGFGRSPKPRDNLYTLKDHMEMIEKSVISPFELKTFHLVAHSMGCTIALALTAKYPKFVRSITLLAPPYFPSSSKDGPSFTMLKRVAEKRVWPPSSFAAAIMSWYEHLGRCVCFFICRNHQTWESLLKLLTRRSDLHFMIMDLTRHTHHSGFRSMHNVICGGARYMDGYLENVVKFGVKLYVIQGDKDETAPLECIDNIKSKVPNAEVCIIANANHKSVILRRKKDLAQNLERIWASCSLYGNA